MILYKLKWIYNRESDFYRYRYIAGHTIHRLPMPGLYIIKQEG